MNVLVLGGNGFIGSHLIDKLLFEGHSVRVYDKCEEHYRRPLHNVEYRFGDFGNRTLLFNTLKDVDIVYHLICTTLPKTSNEDPGFDVLSNVVGTIHLLEDCLIQRIKKFVFISSGGTVYGIPKVLPVSEDSPTEPLCSYGVSKLTIEKYLELFHRLHNLDYVALRPSNAYGERQNPHGIQGVIPVFLGKIAKGESIEVWGDGKIVRDYIYIDDLVNGIYMAAMQKTKSRIFNIGTGIGTSLADIIQIVQRITGMDFEINYLGKRTFDVDEIYLDIRRAREELSWAPITSLEAGIQKTWNFIRRIV